MSTFSQNHSPALAQGALVEPIQRSARIDWVDYAKGICIIFVVMMHTTLGVEKLVGETGWMHHVVAFAQPFRMPDFFLISGLFLANVIDRNWRLYLDRKVLHFFYFYLLWVVIQFSFKAPFLYFDGLTSAEIASQLALTLVQPFGTLWFIYLLPIFFITTKLLKKLPWQWLIGIAALLQIAPIHTGWITLDEFASRYVFFVTGYLLAPKLFQAARWAMDHSRFAVMALMTWAIVNGALVFGNLSDLPIISLGLGFAGALAIVFSAALLSMLRWTKFLRYLGENSIVVYLAFFLPMVVTRMALARLVPELDVGTMAFIGTSVAVISPVVFYKLTQISGWGGFLFKRPNWAKFDQPNNRRKTTMQPAE